MLQNVTFVFQLHVNAAGRKGITENTQIIKQMRFDLCT